MKRDENLQPLSRQHHNGLLMTLLILRGLKRNADLNVIADFIIDGWKKELNQHFIMEEEHLIPPLKGRQFDPLLTDRLLSEHFQIRSIIDKITAGDFTVADITDFAELLERHIRFEERTYFPEAEKCLSHEELHNIGKLLQESEDSNCINYPIKFWQE